ncbi:MAG: lmo0937 family membrane protein [Candidatus Eremiobacteraeota bacterium]|nr:lmo0937 family membrane protein [Candidatus Eremiobacteraeota bacterium]MBV8371667.1 lmo0937 family membrane protein [Candidatus Eremiobacteraeota bacterium]
MLWAIIVVLVVLWLLGFLAFHIGGGLIHILIVIALILLVVNLATNRGARV